MAALESERRIYSRQKTRTTIEESSRQSLRQSSNSKMSDLEEYPTCHRNLRRSSPKRREVENLNRIPASRMRDFRGTAAPRRRDRSPRTPPRSGCAQYQPGPVGLSRDALCRAGSNLYGALDQRAVTGGPASKVARLSAYP